LWDPHLSGRREARAANATTISGFDAAALVIFERMVRLEPISLEWAEALAQGDGVFTERFGIPVGADWAGFPDAVSILVEAGRARLGDWRPQLFFDDDGALIGNGGWKGPQKDAVAEVGYAVALSRQGRGIASTVVRELIERARRAEVRTVIAHTLAEENASTKVLERCGFERTVELTDPDEGPVWRWELHTQP
jgi:RimJ/RimL family protein N-acetyltransferase